SIDVCLSRVASAAAAAATSAAAAGAVPRSAIASEIRPVEGRKPEDVTRLFVFGLAERDEGRDSCQQFSVGWSERAGTGSASSYSFLIFLLYIFKDSRSGGFRAGAE
ncbi:unnamed protein product, partial [Scytosiphon promiscuus]